MATASVDQATLRRTRDTLGKIIKKPPLSDKLLNRPPFRYMHDIISEVTKATGFFKGLYAGAELDAKSFQDKESKIAFLQKAIDVLSFVQGDVVRVKASKIVAGHEAEKTNEFLQLLSIAILKKLDSTEAVQRVLSGERPVNRKRGGGKREGGAEGGREGGEEVRGKERPPETKGRSRGERSKDGREKEGRRRDKEKEKRRDDSQHKNTGPQEGRDGEGRDGGRGERKENRRVEQQESEEVVEGSEVRVQERRELESGEDEGLGSETRLERPSSARGHRRRGETGEREEVGEQEKAGETTQRSPSPPPTTQPQPPPIAGMRRPSSARPAPPRIVQHSSAEDIHLRDSVESGVAPPTVIMDTPGGKEEEEEEEGEGEEDKEYVVGDSAPLAPPTSEGPNILPSVDSTSDKAEGVLTKTIVATKERLERGGGGEREGGEGAMEAIAPAQRRREMEIVRKEMETLREDIQLLCRYTNPMGRVMDYLQEDTDTMIQELERWRAENNSHRENLRREESITENELVPLKSQLEEVELHIGEQREKISSLKASIIRQDDSIGQLMRSIIPNS